MAIFQRHRQAPGTPFESDRFLAYLLDPPAPRGGLRNSFASLRRLNPFIDEVQLAFAIHFSKRDVEAEYTLDDFADRVAQLCSSPQASMASLRNARRRGFGWGAVVLLNLLLFSLAAGLRSRPSIALGIVVLCGPLDVAFAFWYGRYARYYRLLSGRIATRISEQRATRSH